MRGLSPQNEPIWPRRICCRGGCSDFGGFSPCISITTVYSQTDTHNPLLLLLLFCCYCGGCSASHRAKFGGATSHGSALCHSVSGGAAFRGAASHDAAFGGVISDGVATGSSGATFAGNASISAGDASASFGDASASAGDVSASAGAASFFVRCDASDFTIPVLEESLNEL